VQRLSAESAAILREPAMAAKLEAMGFEVVGSDPAQAGAFLQAEVERWGRVIRTAHVVVE
jgi:tripartite-type tricarboxylate transporter receptor subunit TctC